MLIRYIIKKCTEVHGSASKRQMLINKISWKKMFNQDEGKIKCAVGNREIGFWLGKKAENVLISFLTSGFAVFICLWLLVLPNPNNLINHVLCHIISNRKKAQICFISPYRFIKDRFAVQTLYILYVCTLYIQFEGKTRQLSKYYFCQNDTNK